MASKRKDKAAAPDPNRLDVERKADESEANAMGRNAVRPSIGGAVTIKVFGKKYGDGLTIMGLVHSLSEQAKAAQGGDLQRAEAMLMVQAHTLDTIFNELAQRAALNMGEYVSVTETYLRLAFKAQTQCRATLQTLAEIKNPRPVAFVKQANIAHGPQQVNNGTQTGGELHGRVGNSANQPNELLGVSDGERLDTRTTDTTGRTYQDMATVGASDRSTVQGDAVNAS